MKVWQRYLFQRLIRSFLFFFLGILMLYAAIDFSINGLRFLSKEAISQLDIAQNYLRHFSRFFDLFSSLAFLLASWKVLLDCNEHGELCALQIGGLSKKKLLAPFFIFAAFLSLASLGNAQWISPDAQAASNDFHRAHSLKRGKPERLFSLQLQDGSELVYQCCIAKKSELFDVFWICSPNEIWHMNFLDIAPPGAAGRFAERFLRKEGRLELEESCEYRLFPSFPWDGKTPLQKYIPFDSRSLTTLARQAFSPGADLHKSAAHLHFKLAFSLLSLLAIFAIAPHSFKFSRNRSDFLMIGCSLFAFLGLATLLEAMLILAENQVCPAPLAIWGPLSVAFLFSYFSFARM